MGAAVGAATDNGGHSGDSGLDGTAVHRRYRSGLAMLRVLRASDCHRRDSAGRDNGLGRVGVAAGSRLRRSSGHVGGRRCRGGAAGGRSGLGGGDGRGLRGRDGITHGLGGGRAGVLGGRACGMQSEAGVGGRSLKVNSRRRRGERAVC